MSKRAYFGSGHFKVKNGLDMNVMNAVLDSGKTHWANTDSSFHDSLEYFKCYAHYNQF